MPLGWSASCQREAALRGLTRYAMHDPKRKRNMTAHMARLTLRPSIFLTCSGEGAGGEGT